MSYREACMYCHRIFYDKSDFEHHLIVIHSEDIENGRIKHEKQNALINIIRESWGLKKR